MFLDELTPLLKELSQHPIAFLGGFVSSALRLNLADDPVRSWLNQQTGTSNTYSSSGADHQNGKSNGPQSISIE